MRRRIALLCAALATIGGVATNGAHAMPPRGEPDTPIYCDYGHLSGSSTWLAAGIGPSRTNNHYVIGVEADCPAYGPFYETLRDATGPVLPEQSDDAGHYSLRLEGDSVDTCVHGSSSNGVLSGTGPEGTVSGSFRFHRENAHLWISGVMVSGGETHRFTLWLDLVPLGVAAPPPVDVTSPAALLARAHQWLVTASPSFTSVCAVEYVRSAAIIGHGVIRDPNDGWDLLWDTADVAVFTVGGLQDGLPEPGPLPATAGRPCSFGSTTDITAEAQTQTGVADFGPLVMGAQGTVACQTYVNGTAAPAARVSGHTNAAGVAAGAGTITYHANVTDVVDLCTTFDTDAGAHYWWHPASDPTAVPGGRWESGPPPADTSQCGTAVTVDPNPEACPALLAVDRQAGTNLAETWQGCEPYSPII